MPVLIACVGNGLTNLHILGEEIEELEEVWNRIEDELGAAQSAVFDKASKEASKGSERNGRYFSQVVCPSQVTQAAPSKPFPGLDLGGPRMNDR